MREWRRNYPNQITQPVLIAARQSSQLLWNYTDFLQTLFHRIPESQRHSTPVILLASTLISNGPHGFGNPIPSRAKQHSGLALPKL